MQRSDEGRRSYRTPLIRRGLAIVLLCLSGPGWSEVDPFEGVNRDIYRFNDFLDRNFMKPIAKGYERLLPDRVRRSIRNVFRNAGTPAIAANQLLQGKGRLAVNDATRFVMNSTFGIAGIFDVATGAGLPRHEEDFGQTLEVWGVPGGPYVMIPFRGPANVTHSISLIGELFINPIQLIKPRSARYATYALYFIDVRAELLAVEPLVSGDAYLFLREAYLQRREFMVNDGVIENDPFLDDFDEDEE